MKAFSFIISTVLVLIMVYSIYQEPAESGLLILDNSEAGEIFHKLPKEDKETLELLFAFLVNQDQFGYTLISEKPMSLSGGFIKTPYENVLYGYNQSSLFWRRWELWKFHFGKLKFPNFLMIEENFAAMPDIRFVFIINKTLFIQTVLDHSKRFREVTGRVIDPEKLLKALEKGETTLQQAISFSEELLGILLGYGQHNASLYAKRQQIDGPLMIPLALEQSPSPGFASVQEESANICKSLQASYELVDGYTIGHVMFAADRSNPITAELCDKYRKAQLKLSTLYKDHTYLEESLRLLETSGK